jgi:DNA-binding transcriptional LysR family regulator
VDLDLRLVRYFVAVADELHFGRAAAKLHISQPALSKQIRRLEEQIGIRLLTRDSRHVALTHDGVRFLRDARSLLAQATRMMQPGDAGIRIAHIFDLGTCRIVVDAFSARFPDVHVTASSMDSRRQFDALISGLLDVAIVRLTPEMTAEHPLGWRSRALRLEPFWLVGRAGDPQAETMSLYERPLEVFSDPPGSALFNVHGEYLTALEAHLGLAFDWLGNPGTFDQCLSRMMRAPSGRYLLEFESYALRYAQAGMPVHRPAELQPVYPWSLVWREEPHSAAVIAFIEVAVEQAEARRWLQPGSRVASWQPASDVRARASSGRASVSDRSDEVPPTRESA